jgi:Subtilase family
MTESDRHYSAGTVEHNATDNDNLFAADGKKSGHGTIAWLPAPGYVMPEGPDWPSTAPSRVIALLDTGVRQHPWLPELQPGEPESAFLLNAEDYGWQSPVPDDDKSPTPDYSSHWGHATFIAGLIRLAAPGAQVLFMRVMDRRGKVSEDHVAEALTWLADNPELACGIAVNIVLMAFGRPEDPDDEHLDALRAPIKRLTDRGVRIVASAGNDGAERPVYPAAFAAESGRSLDSQRPVLSVGALAGPGTPTKHALATERAPYSNFGPWVTEWSIGTNILSIMPLTSKPNSGRPAAEAQPYPGHGYAWWSGTSFAAATVAAELVAELPPAPLIVPKAAGGS